MHQVGGAGAQSVWGMAVEQLEDNIELWVENEIARQLQTVSLEDDNSDGEPVEVEKEPDMSPDSEVWTVSIYTYALASLSFLCSPQGSVSMRYLKATRILLSSNFSMELISRKERFNLSSEVG